MLVAPAYRDVIVLAHAGRGSPREWDLLPADECAAGRVLLAWRDAWRASQSPAGLAEEAAADIRERGYAVLAPPCQPASIAVPVSGGDVPLTALALTGDVAADSRDSVASEETLSAAARMLAHHLDGDGSA